MNTPTTLAQLQNALVHPMFHPGPWIAALAMLLALVFLSAHRHAWQISRTAALTLITFSICFQLVKTDQEQLARQLAPILDRNPTITPVDLGEEYRIQTADGRQTMYIGCSTYERIQPVLAQQRIHSNPQP